MKVGKPKSKRVPVRLRHKIVLSTEKASAAKQRKQRKLAKKDPTWRTKLKKDPGIPNLFPYKDRILKEVEENRKRKEEDAAKRREQARAQDNRAEPSSDEEMLTNEEPDALLDLEDNEEGDEEGDMVMQDQSGSSNPMAALVASARARASEFEKSNQHDAEESDEFEDERDDDSFTTNSTRPNGINSTKDTSRQSHTTSINTLISTSDVLLYVLDARDPISTRSPAVEKAILADPNKRLLILLNKIDLVPAPVLKSWLVHLKRSFPVLPLRAGASAPNAKTFDHKHLTTQFTANNVIKALKTYTAKKGLSRSLRVGILGYPNVGKSSIVNALTSRLSGRAAQNHGRGNKECPVGAEAGVTTALREIKLDGSIKLVDSPGIVFPSLSPKEGGKGLKTKAQDEIEAHAQLVLLNAVPPREIDDPTPAVSLLLRRFSADPSGQKFQKLLDVYAIPAIASQEAIGSKDVTTDFLVQVARKRGRLGKGGIPNLHAAAQTVVNDWRDGRIQGWVEVPTDSDTQNPHDPAESEGVVLPTKHQQVVVAAWAEEFKIDGLWENSDVLAE